jgi:hypothetical protein
MPRSRHDDAWVRAIALAGALRLVAAALIVLVWASQVTVLVVDLTLKSSSGYVLVSTWYGAWATSVAGAIASANKADAHNSR